jgi:hypothetical protein
MCNYAVVWTVKEGYMPKPTLDEMSDEQLKSTLRNIESELAVLNAQAEQIRVILAKRRAEAESE